MILHFLRHAQAAPAHPGGHARDRLLTQRGRESARPAAKGFVGLGVQIDALISSPYPRALETAKIVADIFQYKSEIQISDNLIPEALFHKFRKEFLESWTEYNAIMIVTHQPFVSECISYLLSGKDLPLAIDMGTASLCTLEVDPSLKGQAILSCMVKAEQAALIDVSLKARTIL